MLDAIWTFVFVWQLLFEYDILVKELQQTRVGKGSELLQSLILSFSLSISFTLLSVIVVVCYCCCLLLLLLLLLLMMLCCWCFVVVVVVVVCVFLGGGGGGFARLFIHLLGLLLFAGGTSSIFFSICPFLESRYAFVLISYLLFPFCVFPQVNRKYPDWETPVIRGRNQRTPRVCISHESDF